MFFSAIKIIMIWVLFLSYVSISVIPIVGNGYLFTVTFALKILIK